MKKVLRNKWKRICATVLAAAMTVTMLPASVGVAATSSSANDDGTFSNPVIYADVPDIDMIRVGDAYYMVSTTMHLSPGCPIMKSTDLVNWEIVNYVYDTLGDTDAMNLRNGESMYANGQWAASLKYYNGVYYVAFNCNTTRTAYLYTTDDIERGSWEKTTLNGFFHDLSLFFDDGKGYLLYGDGGDIKCAELSDDFKSVKKETQTNLFNIKKEDWGDTQIGTNLAGEGTHIIKEGEYYYVFNISWPAGGVRTEICHRSKTFPSADWEKEIILQANFANNGVSAGVAQGAVIDTPDGKWYGFMFQDHGAIGRTPVLTDCVWKDGWPMLGKDGDGKTVEETMQLPVVGNDGKTLVKSDEFYNDAEHRVFEAPAASAAAQAYYSPAAMTDETEMETVELIEDVGFENGQGKWEGFEQGEIELASADNGTIATGNVLHIKNRKNISSSAKYDLTGQIKKGTTYTVKGKMKYDSAAEGTPEKKKFTVRFHNSPAGVTEEWNYRPAVGVVELTKGQWQEFTFTYKADDWKIGNNPYPFGTNKNYFFIENTDYKNAAEIETDPAGNLMDLYFDDISITYQKPKGGGDEPGVITGDRIELITNGGVETGTTDGWTTTPGEENPPTIEAVNTDKASGEYSLYVSNRTAAGQGACQNISGKMQKGKEYTISGKLKYKEGTPDTKQFNVTIQHGKSYLYRQVVGSFTAKKGEWTSFEMTWTPKDKEDQSEIYEFDPDNVNIFVETPWAQNQTAENDHMSYYLDDFSVTTPNENLAGDGSFNVMAPWTAFENSCKVELVKPGYGGAEDQCLKVSERKDDWHGPGIVFGDKMTAGDTYTIKAYVKYDAETPAEQKFYFTMKGTFGDSKEPQYKTMAEQTVKKGEWTEVTGKWTVPEDITDTYPLSLYVNTGSSKNYMDFYLDNVTIEKEKNNDKEPAEAGEHDYNGSNLDLVWQWNHNPNNNNWSLTERDGWLRLKTGSKATSLLNARNTLTQRTFGPACSGKIRMDISKMKPGDVAGLGSLSYNYGYIAVQKSADKTELVMVDASGNEAAKADKPQVKERAECTSDIVYLKEDFNYAGNADGSDRDKVSFYYSFDGKEWTQLGNKMQMSYELTHFMGSKFAIFNYATKSSGGYVDIDYFKVSDQIGTEQTSEEPKASMTATEEINGTTGSECEAKLLLEDLNEGNHGALEASIAIPGVMNVEDVVFNTAAITGTNIETSSEIKGSRLFLRVKGSNISFKATDKLFATIKLRVNGYVSENKNVEFKADYVRIDNGASEYDVTECIAQVVLKHIDTKALAKELGYGNPITTNEFGADPYAIEYNGRVYVYMTADDYEFSDKDNPYSNNFGYITSLRVVSSADLMNWTDHGEIDVAGQNGGKGPAMWASHSWAPAIAYKKVDGKDKFFLYFANDASGIGVLEADTPLGPWRDPIGEALITKATPGCEKVEWCFDPAVLVDDNGSAYIYFGGGVPAGQSDNPKTARVAKLGADMTSLEGDAVEIDAPCMFEDSGIFKFGDTYYYSYCSNFTKSSKPGYPNTGTICYMTSDNPMGPFTYQGEIFSNPSVWFGVGGNNHHATFVFNGKSYFIYHAQTVSKALGVERGYRSTHIDEIALDKDGKIQEIKGTYTGIPQLQTMNPYQRIEAETIAWNSGVKASVTSQPGSLFTDYNMVLTDLQEGDWTSVSQLDFGSNGSDKITVSVGSKNGGTIDVIADHPETGEKLGTIDVPSTGSDDTYQPVTGTLTKKVTGTRSIFLVFHEKKVGATTEDYTKKLQNLWDKVKAAEKSLPLVEQLKRQITKANNVKSGFAWDEKEKTEAMQEKIEAAQLVVNKGSDAAEAEINTAMDELNALIAQYDDYKATDNLLKEKLKYRIQYAEQLMGAASLSDEHKSGLQEAIDSAKQLLKDDNIMNVDYFQFTEAAGTEITDPDKEKEQLKVQLQGQITQAESLMSQLSGAEKDKLQAVINEVKGMLTSQTATKDEIAAASMKLQTALDDAKKTIGSGGGTGKPAVGESFDTADGLKFTITASGGNDLTITLTGTDKQHTTLVIPATVTYKNQTFRVTAIGKQAFANQKSLKSVTIGENVTAIESGAFLNDAKLVKVTFKGTDVTNIAKDAFKGINKKASFDMKKTFTSKNLKYSITKNTLSVKQVTVMGASSKKLTSITVPDTIKYNGMTFKVTAVNKKAFAKQKSLKSATIGKNVKSIGNDAFKGASKLAKVKFKGTALKKIGKNAFKGIKKNATFQVKKSKRAYYKKLLKKAGTKNYKVK